MDNLAGEQLELVDVNEWRRYASLIGAGHLLPAPATYGLCMECDRNGAALWIHGDFLLCRRCLGRRFKAMADSA